MKEIKVTPEKFQFDKFVESLLKFQENISEPIYAVPWIFELNEAPNYNEEGEDRDYLKELKEENKKLYFDFTNVNAGDPVDCADGSIVGENAFEDEEDEELEAEGEPFWGITETLGYLVEYRDNSVVINSALSYGGDCIFPPSIDIKTDCKFLDSLMENFIRSFIID
jgi:hypothetical protein